MAAVIGQLGAVVMINVVLVVHIITLVLVILALVDGREGYHIYRNNTYNICNSILCAIHIVWERERTGFDKHAWRVPVLHASS